MKKDKFVYIYDFCDHWLHEIQVMKIFEPKKTFYPKCIKGAMNRPPEDCGGIHGFENFKEIMGNRKHPKFKEMKKIIIVVTHEKEVMQFCDSTISMEDL